MIKPYPYDVWSTDRAIALAAAGTVPVSQRLEAKPRRHYAVTYSDGTTLAYEDSPSKVVGATEDKGGAMAYYGATHAADYLLDNLDDIATDAEVTIIQDPYNGMSATVRLSPEDREKWWKAARKQHTLHRDAAAQTGTDVHYYIEDMFRSIATGHTPRTTPDAISEPVRQGIEAFKAWWMQTSIEVLHTEIPVCHPGKGYAGTVDVIGRNADGWSVIIDWKTSKNIYPSHIRQVAAYSSAWSAMGHDPILHAYIVHLVKEGPDAGKFHVHEIDGADLDAAEEAWDHSLNLYRYTTAIEKQLKGKQ